jgi:hypothetical protein
MVGYPKTFQTFVAKEVSGWCGCNSKLSLWERNIVNKCPQCEYKKETSKHLMQCMDPGCLLQLHRSIDLVMEVLNKANVIPECAK